MPDPELGASLAFLTLQQSSWKELITAASRTQSLRLTGLGSFPGSRGY